MIFTHEYAGYRWTIAYEPPEDAYDGRSGEGWDFLGAELIDEEEMRGYFFESDEVPLPTPEQAWDIAERDIVASIKQGWEDRRIP